MGYEINGKQVDYDKIIKVTIGDLEDLEERGLSLDKIQKGEFTSKMAIDFITQFASRVNTEVTRDDVRELGVTDLQTHADKIAERINEGQEQTGGPSS